MKLLKSMKNKNFMILFLTNIIMLIYLIISIFCFGECNFWTTKLNYGVVIMIMFIFELLSTLTFQLRIKLSADFEIKKKEKLKLIIPLIGCLSWGVASFEGLLLVSNNNLLQDFFIKLLPVLIATFNGIYINLCYNINIKRKES